MAHQSKPECCRNLLSLSNSLTKQYLQKEKKNKSTFLLFTNIQMCSLHLNDVKIILFHIKHNFFTIVKLYLKWIRRLWGLNHYNKENYLTTFSKQERVIRFILPDEQRHPLWCHVWNINTIPINNHQLHQAH